MPVYNGDRYLEAAIGSILQQTYGNFTLILVDDSSSDDSYEICRAMATGDTRIEVHRNPRRLGGWANLARCIEVASGEFFMWAAQDDLWSADWIERLLPIAQDTGCPAFGVVRPIDELGKGLGHHPAGMRVYPYMESSHRAVRVAGYLWQREWLGKSNPMYSVFPMKVARSLIEILVGAEASDFDYDLVLDVLLETPCIQEPDVYLMKRIHEGNWSRKTARTSSNGLRGKLMDAMQTLVLQDRRVRRYRVRGDARTVAAACVTKIMRRSLQAIEFPCKAVSVIPALKQVFPHA